MDYAQTSCWPVKAIEKMRKRGTDGVPVFDKGQEAFICRNGAR